PAACAALASDSAWATRALAAVSSANASRCPTLWDETCSQPGLALSARAVGSVFEGVFDLVSSLFGVARELIDASFGAQPGVAGGAAEVLLGGALGGLGLMGDLLTDTHCGLLG